MIAAIVIWSYIFILIYLYGLFNIHGLNRILQFDKSAVIDLPLVLLVGIVTVAVIAMLAQLFIPLGAVFMASLSAGALVIFSQKRFLPPVSFPRYRPLTWIILAVVFLTVLVNATHIPSNPDTGLYHAQTIRWYETYRIVPGLGNLQERYAFNSAWLVLNAALSFAFLGLRSFRLVNGILFLIAMLFFAEGVDNMARGKLSLAGLAKLLFLPLAVYLLISDVSSVGTDMPVSLITWLILVLWIEKIESPVVSELKNAIIFLLPIFAFTVKLSSLPLLCFSILIAIEYLLKSKTEWRRIFLLGVLGILILVCWMLRSVILSGYLVFPLWQIDFFPVDWKIPAEQIEPVAQGIVDAARIGTRIRATSVDMTFREWVPLWIEQQTLNRLFIYAFVIVSPFILMLSRNRASASVSQRYLFAYLISFAGSVFWFLAAPDIRFGYGFLIGACVLSVAPLLVPLILKINGTLNVFPGLALLSLLVFQAYILWHSVEPAMFTERLFLPADYRSSKVELCDIQGAVIYCRKQVSLKEGALCQYEAFPCILSPRANVELRGSTYKDGFRTNP